MRIIHLISGGDVGGAKTHVLTLLQGLNQTETVHLVCFMEGDFADEARQMGIPITVIADENLFQVRSRLAAMIRHGKYQVIHCHGARANLIGWMLKSKVNLPVVTTVHSDYRLDYMGRPLGQLTYGLINRMALRRLDYRIGVSDTMANLLISRGFDPQRMFSIYNGIDYSPRKPAVERAAFLRQVGVIFDEDTVVFGIAARINPVKDMTTLVKAFAEARKSCPNIRLLIAGVGEEEEKIKHLASQLCPDGEITFLGWLSDTDSFYNALDVNTLTSLSETFPYALTEGARWHCATIASAVGGVPYLIDNGINGYLFQPQDVAALARHMVQLANDRTLCQKMGESLYQKAKTEFSIDATVQRQKEIYQTIIRRTNRPTRKKDGVFICGAYGRGNVGDEALLQIILEQMRQIDPDMPVCVLTRDPESVKQELRTDAVHTFNFWGIFRKLAKSKLYISGGGTLMQDVTSTRSILYYLLNIYLAKLRGNRVMLYGCGIGPVNQPKNRKRMSKVLDRCADVITVRDAYSLQLLQTLNITKPKNYLTADPALLCSVCENTSVMSYLMSVGLQDDGQYILFALRQWNGFAEKIPAFVSAAEYAYRTYGLIPLLFAMEPRRDASAIEAVAAKLKCPYLLDSSVKNASETVAVIRRMRVVVSMRLHGLIFAAGLGVPTVGVGYDPKVSGFLDYLGSEQYMSLQEVNAAALNDFIDAAISGAGAESLAAAKLRKQAEKNAQIAKELLQS